MKTELKAKYLQHLIKKKNKDEGFTLIELLVVIIIIGILAAIALPSFLNQASRAKESEARNAIGSINTAQSTARTQGDSFAADMDALALGLPTETKNYSYDIAGGQDTATVTATAKDSKTSGFSGGNSSWVDADSSQTINSSVACENDTVGTDEPGTPTVETTAAPTCPDGYTTLGQE